MHEQAMIHERNKNIQIGYYTSTTLFLKLVIERMGSPILTHWMTKHVRSN